MNLTVVIPTRDRLDPLRRTVASILETVVNPPPILVLHDAPQEPASIEWSSRSPSLEAIEFRTKHSLTALWNQAILRSKTEWVCICNDDLVFKAGWTDYLQEAIASGRFRQVN